MSVVREPLNWVTSDDVEREGFLELTPGQFIELFRRHMGGSPTQEVTRIEWRYVS